MTPILYEQSCVPTFPHANTLREALLWDYVLTLDVDHATTVTLAVNPEASTDTSSEFRPSPRRGEGGPLTTRVAPVSTGTREIVTARFGGLHALQAQRVHVDVEGVTFAHALQPMLQNDNRIDIGGTRASLSNHITSLLHDVVADSAFASHELSLECRFRYRGADVPAMLPVLLVTRQEVTSSSIATLAGQCADAIHEWRRMAQPPETGAELIFAVIFWPAGAPDAKPLLHLTNLALAVDDLEG